MLYDAEQDLVLKINSLKEWKAELSKKIADLQLDAKKARDESFRLDVRRAILVSLYESADADSPERKTLHSLLNTLVDKFQSKAAEAVKLKNELESHNAVFKLIEDRISSELATIDIDDEDK
ncbi:hypothetical protein [Paenibacillus cellulositrophicus]|uniref:hypothetical protein n=1 Tax=Paenibacillus cellulositrophicus TaxID=562959 RepID=UPI003D9784CD